MTLIYKIVDNTNGDIYVGSTNQRFQRRIDKHVSMKQRCSSKKIIANGDYDFHIIEECDDSIRDEREEYWINELPTINIQTGLTPEKFKENRINYRMNHKEEKRLYDKKRRDFKRVMGECKSDPTNLFYIKAELVFV